MYLSVFFASIGLAYVYLIPAFAEELGAGYLDLGLIGTVRSLPYTFLPAIVGYLGDRFGRRELYLSSIFIAGSATLLLFATYTVDGIVLVQVLLGVGFSLFWPISEALVSEATAVHERTSALGIYGVAWGSGFLIGPLFGGLIADVASFQIAFLIAGIVVLTTAAVSVIAIRGEAKKGGLRVQASPEPPWHLLSELLPMLLVQIPYAIVFSFVVSIFPGYAIQSGLTPLEVGILVSGFAFTRITMFSLSGRFGGIGERKSIVFAFLGMAIVLLVIPLNRGFIALLADSCLMGAFCGIIYPQTVGYISKHSPSANLGFAIGVCETIFGIGFAAGPIASGFIAQITSPDVTYLVLAVVALSIIPILAFEIWPYRNRSVLRGLGRCVRIIHPFSFYSANPRST